MRSLVKIGRVLYRVIKFVDTKAVQPIGMSPATMGDRAVFAGQKGDVVLFDLENNAVIWHKKTPVKKNGSVLQDITIGKYGVYPYNGHDLFGSGTIYSLDRRNQN